MAESEPRPDLTHGGAVTWALGVTFAWWFAMQELFVLVPSALHDLVILAGAQLPVFLGGCALFAARRPGKSFEELFALRRAPLSLLFTGLLLGFALHGPAERLTDAIIATFPMRHELKDEFASRLVPHGPVHAVLLVAIVAALGPFVEELLYRGALFTALRTGASAVSATITTGLLFTLVHPEPRWWLPIFLMAASIGFLRAQSGSLWPGVLLHGAFNGSTLVVAWSGPRVEALAVSPKVVVGSSLAAVLLLFVAARLARTSPLAERARALDGAHPTGDGATP